LINIRNFLKDQAHIGFITVFVLFYAAEINSTCWIKISAL